MNRDLANWYRIGFDSASWAGNAPEPPRDAKKADEYMRGFNDRRALR